jgi:hypothetical protein
MVVGNPLDTRDNTRVGARSAGIENLDTDNLDGLRDTVGASTDGSGAVSTVSVLISVLILGSVARQQV